MCAPAYEYTGRLIGCGRPRPSHDKCRDRSGDAPSRLFGLAAVVAVVFDAP